MFGEISPKPLGNINNSQFSLASLILTGNDPLYSSQTSDALDVTGICNLNITGSAAMNFGAGSYAGTITLGNASATLDVNTTITMNTATSPSLTGSTNVIYYAGGNGLTIATTNFRVYANTGGSAVTVLQGLSGGGLQSQHNVMDDGGGGFSFGQSGSNAGNIGTGSYSGQITIGNTSNNNPVLFTQGSSSNQTITLNSTSSQGAFTYIQSSSTNKAAFGWGGASVGCGIYDFVNTGYWLQQGGTTAWKVLTHNNTLDNGSGSMTIAGDFTPAITSIINMPTPNPTGAHPINSQIYELAGYNTAQYDYYSTLYAQGLLYNVAADTGSGATPFTIQSDGSNVGFAAMKMGWRGITFYSYIAAGSSNIAATDAQFLALATANFSNNSITFYQPVAATTFSGAITIQSTAAASSVSAGALIFSNNSFSIGRAGTALSGNPTELNFGQAYSRRMICLYDGGTIPNQDQHQYFGFGVTAGTLSYNVDSTGSHKFYTGTSSSASTLLFTIAHDASVTTFNNVLDDGAGVMTVGFEIFSKGYIIAHATDGYYWNDGTGSGGANYFHITSSSSGGLTFTDDANTLTPFKLTTKGYGYFDLGIPWFKTTVPSISTGSQTITAAQILDGIVLSPVQSSAYTWTTDTGTALYSAMGSPAVGTTVTSLWSNANNAAGAVMTIAFGSGISGNLRGNTLNNNQSMVIYFRCTGTNTFTCYS